MTHFLHDGVPCNLYCFVDNTTNNNRIIRFIDFGESPRPRRLLQREMFREKEGV